jgi:hypothetical protein
VRQRVYRATGWMLRALVLGGGFAGAVGLAVLPVTVAVTVIQTLLIVGLVGFAVTATLLVRSRPLEDLVRLARPRNVGLFFAGVLALAGIPSFPAAFLVGVGVAGLLLVGRASLASGWPYRSPYPRIVRDDPRA